MTARMDTMRRTTAYSWVWPSAKGSAMLRPQYVCSARKQLKPAATKSDRPLRNSSSWSVGFSSASRSIVFACTAIAPFGSALQALRDGGPCRSPARVPPALDDRRPPIARFVSDSIPVIVIREHSLRHRNVGYRQQNRTQGTTGRFRCERRRSLPSHAQGGAEKNGGTPRSGSAPTASPRIGGACAGKRKHPDGPGRFRIAKGT